MLQTTLNAVRSRKRIRQVVEGYLTRWRIEETIWFIKQSYEIEDVRLLKFDRLRAMVAIVSAAAFFSMAWLGLGEKLHILAENVKRISQRMLEMPDFHFYAIADGVSMQFTRHGRWNGLDGPDGCRKPKGLFQATLAI